MLLTVVRRFTGVIRCTGNAGLVVDTDPEDTSGKLTVMVCGHADKIRMQVRHITDDGKVYVDSVRPVQLSPSRRCVDCCCALFRNRSCQRH